jgi:hypothetical protein
VIASIGDARCCTRDATATRADPRRAGGRGAACALPARAHRERSGAARDGDPRRWRARRRGTRCADTPAMATIKIDAALELSGTSLTRFFAGPVSVTFPGL